MRIVLASLGCALVACGTSSSHPGTTASPDMAMAATCHSDGQPATLAAHYGVKVNMQVNVKVPSDCMGDSCTLDKDATSQLLMLVDVTQNGQALTLASHPCHLQIPVVALKGQPPTVLTAKDALVQSVKVAPSTAMLDGPNTCANFMPQPLALVIGAHLAMPATDALPVFANGMVKLCDGKASSDCDSTMDTGCVCDQDKDGKAGATVGAMGVPVLDDVDQIYLALRTVVGLGAQVWPASPGQATPGPRFKGQLTQLDLTQSPVGCHHMPSGGGQPYDCMANEVGEVVGFNPKLSPSQNTPSTFVAMPVGDGETCDKLVADAPTLFKDQ